MWCVCVSSVLCLNLWAVINNVCDAFQWSWVSSSLTRETSDCAFPQAVMKCFPCVSLWCVLQLQDWICLSMWNQVHWNKYTVYSYKAVVCTYVYVWTAFKYCISSRWSRNNQCKAALQGNDDSRVCISGRSLYPAMFCFGIKTLPWVALLSKPP